MKIIKELTIDKPVEAVWEVLGNQFGAIDKWASLISKSELSSKELVSGVVRSTLTTGGPTKQELTSFNAAKHIISYKAIAGAPFFAKGINATWYLTKTTETSTKLFLDFEIIFKGIGGILSPIVRKKLGGIGDILLEELKFYIENGKPHPRKLG